MKEGPDVRGGLLKEVRLQLGIERLKKEEVISGEEVESNLNFEAQGKRLFPLPFLAFSIDEEQPSRTNLFLLPKRCYLSLSGQVLLGPSLTGCIVVRTQGKPLRGNLNLSMIKLEMVPWVYKKQKKRCSNFAIGIKE